MTQESSTFFCSYARDDATFVRKLIEELREAGAELWLDQLDIVGGQRWDEAVEAALESCRGLVAVLSPTSVASQNFMDEVSYALEEQKQIIPVLYQECAIPFRLRRLQHVDFVDDYHRGFADLLRALGVDRPAVEREPQQPAAAENKSGRAQSAAEVQRGVGSEQASETEAPRTAPEHRRNPIEAAMGVGFGIAIALGLTGLLTLLLSRQDWNLWLGISIPAIIFGTLGLLFFRRLPLGKGFVALLIACAILGLVIFTTAPG